ncbi:hypothetical protein P9112_009376 [Eukaryota sp. TZLM1-RC]
MIKVLQIQSVISLSLQIACFLHKWLLDQCVNKLTYDDDEEEVEVDFDDEDETAQPSYETIDRLTDAGISATDVKKLREAGFYTVKGVLMHTKKDLCAVRGLSEAKVEKILEAANKLVFSGFASGREIASRRAAVLKVSTGSHEFDTLLGGGVETMSITEVFGEFRTGKTQICHTLCVTTQLPRSQGGANGKVAYIDTEGTFRPERIGPIAERFGMDPDQSLDNIIYARAYTHEHQMSLLSQIAEKMTEGTFRLLIVDSVTALFRVDFSGRGELAERQQKLAQMLSKLVKLAEDYNIAIFLTNQVIADPGATAMFMADPKKPAGGHVLAHASTCRISLRKGRGEQRIAKIYDSPSLPEAEATYAISNGGIVDAEG